MCPLDPRHISFSQAQGYEPLPQPLKLGELSNEARITLWNVLYEKAQIRESILDNVTSNTMKSILRSIHIGFLMQPLDTWRDGHHTLTSLVRPSIFNQPFNKVFDLLTFIIRHPQASPSLVDLIATTFKQHQLAYFVNTDPPPTIYPMSTPEEGEALRSALAQIRQAGYDAAREHLQRATGHINQQDWAGSVRESIHAVESVARQIAPNAKTLGEALQTLKRKGLLNHPALYQAFNNIYGYANDEQGIRHALLDKSAADVGQDEALFMLGACASLASYLSRKQTSMSE